MANNCVERVFKLCICTAKIMAVAVFANLVIGCSSAIQSHQAGDAEAVATLKTATREDQEALQLFEDIFQQWVARSPIFQAWLGIKTDQDKWDDLSDSFAQESHQLDIDNLARLNKLEPEALSADVKLSLRLLQAQLQDSIDSFQWRYHNYPVNQMFGSHTEVVSVLMNFHKIDSEDDALDYIARLNALPDLFEQLVQGLQNRAAIGVIPPQFVFPHVISASENIIAGAPFSAGEPSPIYADFTTKLAASDLDPQLKQTLSTQAEVAFAESFKPAYDNLITYLKQLQTRADTRDGAWKFPQGNNFYNFALQSTTTTDLTADEIHQLGLQEVARIKDEMKGIMTQVNFDGSLADFYSYIGTDDQFYLPATAAGRNEYLQRVEAVFAEMQQRLPELFITLPSSKLLVKAVEPYREKTSGMAFYLPPPSDGSRPGIFYANLYDMASMPVWEMQALAYHEGIPGHHLQLSVAAELKAMPTFRKHARYTAYTEGWGLYAEALPKSLGLYTDPYADFGRLSLEMWRACRLVVDTGIHAKQWTREQAIDYLSENTAASEERIRKAIERYIVMPSQATAYKIGMLKFQELRDKAQRALGDKFDIRAYHERVLSLGAVPLDVLEEQVDLWVGSYH